MLVASVFNKAKIHIKNLANAKSVYFTLYTVDGLIARRILSSTRNPEKHLEPYMNPRRNGCFVDVGANVGLWTLYMLKKKIQVYAFEPSPRPYKILKEHEKRYSDLLRVYPVALGETENVAQLLLHHQPGHDSLLNTEHDFTGFSLEVNVKTLDSFNLQNIGLIKIDTEGYEVPVLLGAKETILKNKPRLIIEVHKGQLRKIAQVLRDLNYRHFICYRRNFLIPTARHILAEPIGK